MHISITFFNKQFNSKDSQVVNRPSLLFQAVLPWQLLFFLSFLIWIRYFRPIFFNKDFKLWLMTCTTLSKQFSFVSTGTNNLKFLNKKIHSFCVWRSCVNCTTKPSALSFSTCFIFYLVGLSPFNIYHATLGSTNATEIIQEGSCTAKE